MIVVDIHEAKTQFSRLLEQVEQGEDLVIARAGHPVARLVPYVPEVRKIAPPGAMAGEIWLADDFDTPVDDLFACLDGNRPG